MLPAEREVQIAEVRPDHLTIEKGIPRHASRRECGIHLLQCAEIEVEDVMPDEKRGLLHVRQEVPNLRPSEGSYLPSLLVPYGDAMHLCHGIEEAVRLNVEDQSFAQM